MTGSATSKRRPVRSARYSWRGHDGARYSPPQLLALGFDGRPLKRRVSDCGIHWLAGSSKNAGRGQDHSRHADESHESTRCVGKHGPIPQWSQFAIKYLQLRVSLRRKLNEPLNYRVRLRIA